ncbi:hypothetical protein [Microbulbifer sp. GL-2]|uniref:hypothetical protein n=1 Tax=unclassified Microbulbifer TaxID=2619833 RepID=UPI00116345E0|nr:hypothetical protein [Microbulbifer sp. GL-2]BBM03934.1 hypothetical protein GL2_40080 [Microbulbifer sp. GL-2]
MKKNTAQYLTLIGIAFALSVPTVMADEKKEKKDEQFKECFAARLWSVSGRSLNNGELPEKTVKVPEGWKVVAGGGGASGARNEAFMILCR